MEPQRGLVMLTMTLRGTPEELDRKFGRLLWLGNYLVEKDVRFEIRTPDRRWCAVIVGADGAGLNKATDTLLCAGEAKEGSHAGTLASPPHGSTTWEVSRMKRKIWVTAGIAAALAFLIAFGAVGCVVSGFDLPLDSYAVCKVVLICGAASVFCAAGLRA